MNKLSNAIDQKPLLEVDCLTKHFPIKKGIFAKTVAQVRAVDGVSFQIRRGESVGMVGESGCGKTTVGRVLLNLIRATDGSVKYDGVRIDQFSSNQMKSLRRRMQIIFQDPYGSLNPRMNVRSVVTEGMDIHSIGNKKERLQKAEYLVERVGLDPKIHMNRYPHEFSGGQRQRLGIARALSVEPEFIVCDEAVSALDVSIQAQVINLLLDLKDEFSLSYLFIAHDLAVVEHISDRVLVMYLGRVVEEATAVDLFNNPRHPYTQALLAAVPNPDPRVRKDRPLLIGDVPSPIDPPSGCRFHTRCPKVMSRCSETQPQAFEVERDHFSHCFLEEMESK